MQADFGRLTVALGIASLGALNAACGASGPNVVAQRAQTELACPREQVKVEPLGGSSYRATGCGKVATYTCLGGNAGNPYDAICTREAASNDPPRATH